MSLSICADCLSKLRIPSKIVASTVSLATTTASTSSFHSSATQYANPLKKKSGTQTPLKFRESRSAKIKRKGKERPKPPAVGERRAARRRIVLSNTNALEVQGMEDLSVKNMCDAEKVGQMLGLEGPLLDQLRDAKAFKRTQNWHMFRKPATLMRGDTVHLGQDIKEVNGSQHDQGLGAPFIRRLITGERASGKSVMLLQAMCMAFLSKWVVIHVPEGQDYILNQSSYAPLALREGSREEQLYIQPHLTADLLSRTAHANDGVLRELKLNNDPPKGLPVKKNMTLRDLALAGAEDHTRAWPAWQAFWKELTGPGSGGMPRPPVLIAIDGLDHWMGPSKYRSAESNVIHAHQFTLIRQFISLLFSTKDQLTNGGMIVAATTGSNTPSFPSFPLLLRQMAAREAGTALTDPTFPMPEPYSKVDPWILDLLHGSGETIVTTLTGLSGAEAKGLLEYYAKSGLLQTSITNEFVGEMRGLSGGGMIGEIAKFGKRVRV